MDIKPISLQMYTVRTLTKVDYPGTLKQLVNIGYPAIEGGHPGARAKEQRKILDDLGLVSSSAHVPTPKKENVAEICDAAAIMGYSTLISGYGLDSFKTIDGVKKTAEDFETACQLVKPYGMSMAYHNHWWEMDLLDGKMMYDTLMELAPSLLAEIDIYWACNFGKVDVPAVVRKYAKRAPFLHIKDGPLVFKQPHTAAGKGKMDIPACVAAADNETLKWLVVELDECATDMMQAVADSYEYLTKTVKLAKGKK